MSSPKNSNLEGEFYDLSNYSPKIQEVLLNLNVRIGDKIVLTKGNDTYVGYLLPRGDVGDPNAILLKLETGYNIGIVYDNNVSITRISNGITLHNGTVKPSHFISQHITTPKISLISTGGTIASRIDYTTGGVNSQIKPEDLLELVPKLRDIASIELLPLFNLNSEDIWYKQWIQIAEKIYELANDNITSGIVITHGTDTMHFSSAAISFMIRNLPFPVVFTGSQRSADRGSFDGALNLICSCYATIYSNIAEVVVCMHNTISDDECILIRGVRARKMHTSRRDAFKSINEPPLAKIDPSGKITIINKNYRKRSNNKLPPILDTKFEEKIAIIKAYPGSDPNIIDYYVDHNYRGLIIEGTGLGHTPTLPPPDEKYRSWLPHIKRALDEGVFIGMTSQCINGRVHPNVYKALRLNKQAGVTYLEDMLTETAYVKLGWVLGRHSTYEEIKKHMLTNYVGEISSVSRIYFP